MIISRGYYATLCLALRQSSCMAFSWRRIFFPQGRDLAGWFQRISMGFGYAEWRYGDGFRA
jgi:hypothetical protein